MTRARTVVAAAAAGALLTVLVAAALQAAEPGAGGPDAPSFGEALWSLRGADVALQSFILLAAVLGVLLAMRTAQGGWPDE